MTAVLVLLVLELLVQLGDLLSELSNMLGLIHGGSWGLDYMSVVS